MKKILILSLMSLACIASLADTVSDRAAAGQGTTVTTGSQAGAQSSNDGNAQSITIQSASVIPTDTTVHQIVGGTQTIKNTPSVSGPPLTSSNDTCMGSASGAVNGPGFGLSLGKTYTDTNCIMLKNSRELWNMGFKAAAMARMCMDPDNKEALELTGFMCPTRKQDTANTTTSTEPTDPYVRSRMGLAPLVTIK